MGINISLLYTNCLIQREGSIDWDEGGDTILYFPILLGR